MKQIVLKIKEEKYQFFMELINGFDFILVEENSGDTKEEIIANLKQGFKELKQFKEGKLKGIPSKKLLDEL